MTGPRQSSCLPAHTLPDGYDLHMLLSVEELEKQLNAGAWLRAGQVAKIFSTARRPDQPQITRWTVVGWVKSGKIGYRRTPGGHRECKPEDVLALLAEYRTERRDS